MDDPKIFHIAEIVAKSLRTDLTEAEQAELEAWKNSSPERLRMVDEFSRHSFIERKFAAERYCGKEKAYRRFLERQRIAGKRRRLQMVRYAVAAMTALVLTIGGILFYRTLPEETKVVAEQALLSGSSKAILTLADGRRVDLEKVVLGDSLFNRGVRVDTFAGRISYHAASQVTAQLVYNQLDIPRKGEYMLVLEDGTKVWLNSESSLRYPVAFKGNERRVFLKGEAYFEVAHNERMPFVVESGVTETRVLGTSFNVRAYADEAWVYATLEEGSVRFSSGGVSLVLKPDEQGRLDIQSGEIDKRQVDTKLYTSWREGRFSFENQTLDEMMRTLSRWYDLNVFFSSEEVKQAMFSGNLRRYDDFGQIVNMLEMTGVAHFQINGNTIVISKN